MPVKGASVWVVSESCLRSSAQKFPFGIKFSLKQMYLAQVAQVSLERTRGGAGLPWSEISYSFLLNFDGSKMDLSPMVREREERLSAPQPSVGCWLMERPQFFP